jgi:ABC-type uncharacterized transport system involved in gliding motility auxiliary subunit
MNKRVLSGTGLLLAAGLFVAVNVLANALLTSWRLDATDQKLFTLSAGTRNILQNIDEPISLKFYFSAKQMSGIPTLQSYGNRVRDMLEEYAAAANGKIKLTIIDPEQFSEAEDQAVMDGIKQLPLGDAGELGYLGVAGSNSTDDQANIPLLQPNKEASLEYDLTKLVYSLAHPKKRVIGVISALPVFSGDVNPESGQAAGAWVIGDLLKESFDIRTLALDGTEIPKEIDTLVVVHPKKLAPATVYAIDQFVLKGGKAMVFVDPFSESDRAQPDPQNPMALPAMNSDIPELLERWGVKLLPDKISGDIDAAIRVNYNSPRGPQEISYLPWLRLTPNNFSRSDFITSELKAINLATAGVLEKQEGATTEVTPLLSTGKQSMSYERDAVIFTRDPNDLLNSFKPGDKELLVAVRIRGQAKTAFPQGRPKKADSDPTDAGFVAESSAPINVVVVADTDLLADRFWVQMQNFLGMKVPSTLADNATFIVNALDNLGGNDDLISLRSRGEYSRPFGRVQEIQREAEAQFRDKEQALRKALADAEQKLAALEQKKDGGNNLLLSPEQKREIDAFREQQLQTRKELRAVQHELNKNIAGLGSVLKFINIGLIPLLLGSAAILLGLVRARRQPAT